jgi:hypothetical protein
VPAIPAWAAHARALPWNFAASSLGAAVSILELAGHRLPAMNVLGIASAAVLTVLWVRNERDERQASRPLTEGASGWLIRTGKLLGGPLPLVLRAVWPASAPLRVMAATCAIAGAVLSRFAWIAVARASVLPAALVLLLTPGLAAQQSRPLDRSTSELVTTAARYVDKYQEEFKFLLADEAYVQRVMSASGTILQERHLKGELFMTFLPGDDEWIAVHDFKEVDGKPVQDREDVRALLQKGDVRGTAARIAAQNARFNIGRLGRNFNEPTLPLLLLNPRRVKDIDFDRDRVTIVGGRTVVSLRFRERERPTLIRNAITGAPIFAKGLLTMDALTGRVERTQFEIDIDRTTSRLFTEYELDERLNLWVPVVFRERYDDARERERQVILCEARYTNYRRFEVTGRIKKQADRQ